jgi:dolichol-phosphate mannosyltransferase
MSLRLHAETKRQNFPKHERNANMKRAIITGATGFVGANLARRLLCDGHEVHLLVRREHCSWRIEHIRDQIQMHEIDFQDADSVNCIVAKIKPNWIFHLATYGAYSSQEDVDTIYKTNLFGTINLLNACCRTGFESFVNTGSSSEYGLKSNAPAEDEILEPNSNYAIAKAAATHFCQYTANKHQLNIPTLRLYSVYGPYEEPSRLIPSLVKYGFIGSLPPLVDPKISRDFVYIDDVCDAFILAAKMTSKSYGAIFNVGTGIQTSLEDLVALTRRLFNIDQIPKWGSMPNRLWDTTNWQANINKIESELEWSPKYTLQSGFSETIKWHANNPEKLK